MNLSNHNQSWVSFHVFFRKGENYIVSNIFRPIGNLDTYPHTM